MIPIRYKLRDGIRFEAQPQSILVVSEVPLNVIRAGRQAVDVLRLCDGRRTLEEIATETVIGQEEKVFGICDYFNKKSVLETCVIENRDFFPAVTVIIPTRDRKEELVECLESVSNQDYPPDKMEVIVIDDGSRDGTDRLAHSALFQIIRNRQSRGPSYCRNLGVKMAKGEVVAFLDDDCVAGRSWLKDLVPCFQWDKTGAVGGYVDGYSDLTLLDRYEKVFSPLNLGRHILFGKDDSSNFYLPGCSLLVRKAVYSEIGGVGETLHLGEDVDFCWRMRASGRYAFYVPAGAVKHKHRNRLATMSKRRADYGTSEAVLARLHPEKRKTLHMPVFPAVSFLFLSVAILLFAPMVLLVSAVCVAVEALKKFYRLRHVCPGIPLGRICFSVVRVNLSFIYFAAFHLIRFYSIPLILLGFLLPSAWLLGFFFLICASVTDYSVKHPRVAFPVFLFYYLADHISYQIGVFLGCVRERSFRSFKIKF
jgi:mycofactocin glycosyltransferase